VGKAVAAVAADVIFSRNRIVSLYCEIAVSHQERVADIVEGRDAKNDVIDSAYAYHSR
jgi:hypothetical protein